jgi:hypothetical protein
MTIDFLCTALGSLVYFDAAANRLRHAPAPPRNAALITEDGRSWLTCRDGDVWQRLDRLSAGGHVGLAGDDAAPLLLTTRYLADGLLAPEANGLSLSAEPDGGVSLSRPIQGPRESFAPVSEADLDFLDDIRGRSWVNTSGKTIKDGIRLAPSFRAQIGDLTVPLRALLAARHRRHPDGFSVLFDGWKVETLTAFRPLVYFAAYGKPEAFGSLTLALQALQEFGRYDGDILIFCDRSQDQISSVIPPGLHRQVRIATAPAQDVLDTMAVKYRICDMPALAEYRPLLFLRTDVICNRPLEPLLFALLYANRICVPLEHDLMGDHNLYGANLFGADDAATKRHQRGFSTGIIGIPNTQVARRVFPTLLDSLYALARSLGTRQLSPWHDQPLVNYLLYKTGEANVELLTQLVITPVLFDRPLADIPRIGFAHFGGGGNMGDPNLPLMRAYLDLLRNTV